MVERRHINPQCIYNKPHWARPVMFHPCMPFFTIRWFKLWYSARFLVSVIKHSKVSFQTTEILQPMWYSPAIFSSLCMHVTPFWLHHTHWQAPMTIHSVTLWTHLRFQPGPRGNQNFTESVKKNYFIPLGTALLPARLPTTLLL